MRSRSCFLENSDSVLNGLNAPKKEQQAILLNLVYRSSEQEKKSKRNLVIEGLSLLSLDGPSSSSIASHVGIWGVF